MRFDKEDTLNRAERLAADFNLEEVERFAHQHRGASWFSDFILLYKMITDKNFSVDTRVYMTIAGALAYVVLPIDVIPDFIPGFGFIDDLFVVGFVMKSLTEEVERFKHYKGGVSWA